MTIQRTTNPRIRTLVEDFLNRLSLTFTSREILDEDELSIEYSIDIPEKDVNYFSMRFELKCMEFSLTK